MEGSHYLSPGAKVRFKKMIEKHNAAAAANKKKNKNKTMLEIIAEKLYGGSSK